MLTDKTCVDVLREAARLIERVGWTRGANARSDGGKACSVFYGPARAFSIYGAIVNVLGPGVGDKALQSTAFWRLVTQAAWAELPEMDRGKVEHALHALNDLRAMDQAAAARHLRKWSIVPDIAALGEFQ